MAKTTEVIPNPLEDENKGVEQQAAIKSVAGIPVHVTPPLSKRACSPRARTEVAEGWSMPV